jgi:hypothetical protein
MPEFAAAKRVAAWTTRSCDSWPGRSASCRFADRVITVTDTWRHALAARSTSIEKVGVVMNLADPRFFAWTPRDRTEVRDTWRIVYHGTLTHRYGVDLLLQAAHDVTDEIPEIHVDLLGDGDAREELIALTTALGLDGQVTFSDGMLAVTALSQAICDADVGVVPNRDDVFTDGLLPTKLLEYVAIGTPVVSARTSGSSRVRRWVGRVLHPRRRPLPRRVPPIPPSRSSEAQPAQRGSSRVLGTPSLDHGGRRVLCARAGCGAAWLRQPAPSRSTPPQIPDGSSCSPRGPPTSSSRHPGCGCFATPTTFPSRPRC